MKNFTLLIISFFFVFASCSEFLEEKSQDEVNVTTTQDFSELLLCYMGDDNGWEQLYALDDDISINENKLSSYSENGTILSYSGCYTWQPDMWERDNKLSDGYQYTYTLIMGTNAVIDGIDKAIGTQEERDVIKAEALGLRGFYYLVLVNLYALPYNMDKTSLGVPLKLNAAVSTQGIPRSSVEDVYSQIIKDLTASVELFEKWPKRRGEYRINATVAYIWLSRVYLYMEEWEKAEEAASKAIASGEGLTDYTKLDMSGEFELASYDHAEVEWIYGDNAFPWDLSPSEDLLSKYTSGDRRYELWFENNYTVLKTYVSGYTPTNTIRLSEAYLNRAEAYVQLQNADAALADLNLLRKNRIVNYQDKTLDDVEDLLEEVRLERRLELCYDGHRWFDLRRYGMPSITHRYKTKMNTPWVLYTLREKDPLYVLPIPRLMMENNPVLVQNPSANEPERVGVPESNL